MGDENKQRCIESGMNAVINKPLTPKNCRDILNTFIPEVQTPKIESTDSSNSNAEFLNFLHFQYSTLKKELKLLVQKNTL